MDQAKKIYDNLEGRSKKDFIELVKKGTEIYSVNDRKTERLSKEYADARANDEALVRSLVGDEANLAWAIVEGHGVAGG